jgi:hypothetical protein
MTSSLSVEGKDRPPPLTELSSQELKSDMSVIVSGEIARGGLMGVGEDVSLVWSHAMSCVQSYWLFRVVNL